MKKTDDRRWLAIINVGYGGGSYARFGDKEKAIKEVMRICKRDWQHLFKIKKGQEVTINVVDTTGHDNIAWDDYSVWDSDTNVNLNDKLEKVKRTF